MSVLDYIAGIVLAAAPGNDQWAIEQCKDYIKQHGLTKETVKLVQRDNATLVIRI